MKLDTGILLQVTDHLINFPNHVSCVIRLADFSVYFEQEVHIVRVGDLIRWDGLTQHQETILLLAQRPRVSMRERVLDHRHVAHVQKQNVGADSLLPRAGLFSG